jgi:hypothetical protein
LNLTLGYKLGSGYDIGTRLLLYSGLPVRELGVVGGNTNERSEPFVRVDLRASKEWRLSWTDLTLIMEVLNATFSKEILGCVAPSEGPAPMRSSF